MQDLEQDESGVHRHHGEFAMREIDDPHHAEDDRQTQRHQSIDKTGEQPLNDDIQGGRRHCQLQPALPLR